MSNTKTGIEWCDATWSPVTGCQKVSEGCRNCYAERVFDRMAKNPKAPMYHGRKFTDVMVHPERLNDPLRWKKPLRVFVNSMSDLFHEDVPRDFIMQVANACERSRQHTFIILTKRPERMREIVKRVVRNVWLGVSVEDQKTADARIPVLLQTPAAVRCVSYEPALGPVDLESVRGGTQWIGGQRGCGEFSGAAHKHSGESPHKHGDSGLYYGDPRQLHHHHDARCGRGLDWVIAGGESGPNARPSNPDWFRKVRDQCAAAGVPFFFKQWGDWAPNCLCDTKHAHPTIERPSPGSRGCMFRCGKKRAGRLLDGVEHSEFPEVAR